MRICLINPPWHINKTNVWFHIKPSFPHLGLLSLAAVIENEGVDVDILDFAALFLSWIQIEQKIKLLNYEYFGITATTSTVNSSYYLSKIIKRFHPYSKVIFGGIHVSVLPEEAFHKGAADFVIRGEGEESLLKLLKGDSFNNIPGLSYPDGAEIRHIQPEGLVADLDLLPFPAYHKVDLNLYRPTPGSYKRLPAINMVTSRGCPGKCIFCNSAQRKLRRRSAENIFKDIETLYKNYGIKEIAFYDDTFTVYPTTVVKLCNLLIEHKIDITWSCFARADFITFDLLKIMKSAGCHQIMYGIESASKDILKNIKKNINLTKSKEAITMSKEVGIEVRCAFMLGNPGETRKTIDETIKYSLAVDPDVVIYNISTPFPGTEMFEWAEKNNYLTTRNWDDYDLSEPVMILPTIDRQTLRKKYIQAFWTFYFRPKFIIKKLFSVNFVQAKALFVAVAALCSLFIKSIISKR
jgi:radical SAM superfamily enzyme YgiQ (UPF0313 family)